MAVQGHEASFGTTGSNIRSFFCSAISSRHNIHYTMESLRQCLVCCKELEIPKYYLPLEMVYKGPWTIVCMLVAGSWLMVGSATKAFPV